MRKKLLTENNNNNHSEKKNKIEKKALKRNTIEAIPYIKLKFVERLQNEIERNEQKMKKKQKW